CSSATHHTFITNISSRPLPHSTLALHAALPIYPRGGQGCRRRVPCQRRDDLAGDARQILGAGLQVFVVEAAVVGGDCLGRVAPRSEEHTSELQSRVELVCRLLLEKTKAKNTKTV